MNTGILSAVTLYLKLSDGNQAIATDVSIGNGCIHWFSFVFALCRSVTQLNCFSKAGSQSYNVPSYAHPIVDETLAWQEWWLRLLYFEAAKGRGSDTCTVHMQIYTADCLDLANPKQEVLLTW